MDWGACLKYMVSISVCPWPMLPLNKVPMKPIFTEELWNDYVEKVESNFILKTYPQFDPYFNFLKDKNRLHNLLSDPTMKRMKNHNFIPLVKILQKSARYRWQEDKELL